MCYRRRQRSRGREAAWRIDLKGEQTQLEIKDVPDGQLVALPNQIVGNIKWKAKSRKVRRLRMQRQKNEWYERNKDWSNEKRNAIRRERYKTDPEYRRVRISQS